MRPEMLMPDLPAAAHSRGLLARLARELNNLFAVGQVTLFPKVGHAHVFSACSVLDFHLCSDFAHDFIPKIMHGAAEPPLDFSVFLFLPPRILVALFAQPNRLVNADGLAVLQLSCAILDVACIAVHIERAILTPCSLHHACLLATVRIAIVLRMFYGTMVLRRFALLLITLNGFFFLPVRLTFMADTQGF